MNNQPNATRPASLTAIFVTIFILVFVLVVMMATLVTFILPEWYVSEARLKLSPATNSAVSRLAGNPYDPALAATESATVQSEIVLGRVITELSLNAEWGRKYANGEKLKTSESMAILKGRLDVRSIPNTTLISIRAYSDDRAEAARVANAVAGAYLAAAPESSPFITARWVDGATPAFRPVRPNKPLNIALGVVVGAIVAAGCAAVVTALTASYQAKRRASPPPPGGGLKPIH